MIIAAWIMLIFFGYFTLSSTYRFMATSKMNWFHAVLWFVAIIISALAAGTIWGGLFQ